MCDRDIYPTIGLAALNTGGPIGVYLFGMLNDRMGRRVAYFTCLATLLVGSFMTAASAYFWQWALSRAVVGLTIPAVYQIPFIIGRYSHSKLTLDDIIDTALSFHTLSLSPRTSWAALSIICNSNDVHILYVWHHDVGWSDIFNT